MLHIVTDLPLDVRRRLGAGAVIRESSVATTATASDGTIKVLLRWPEGGMSPSSPAQRQFGFYILDAPQVTLISRFRDRYRLFALLDYPFLHPMLKLVSRTKIASGTPSWHFVRPRQ